ncbi:MAG: type II secretion system major pseudopilin GspG [Bdellovibrionales bacterium]
MRAKNLLTNSRGMTLIEIVIVLIIIATLAATIGGGIMDRFQKSKQNSARIAMAEISKALDMYYTDCSKYPTTEQGLDVLINAPTSCRNWGPKAYLKKNLLKDPWGNDYEYEKLSSSEFVVSSLGADGEEGGTALDSDISTDEDEEDTEE